MHTEATAERVIGFLEQARGFRIWVDGGWGVDALLGQQTRPHDDLDLVLSRSDTAAFLQFLDQAGFRRLPAEGLVYESTVGLRIDVHLIEFDSQGWGAFDLGDGREWPFPPSAFRGEGLIAGRPVACLSPDAQVQCHGQGYVPRDKDIQDMLALQARFELVLPLALGTRVRRDGGEG